MGSDSEPPRAAPITQRLTVSPGLAEAHLYRPGPVLAAAILLAPAVLALAAATVSLEVSGVVPVWLALLLLLWVPALPAAWIGLVSVRTTPTSIAAARPWRTWKQLPWALIDAADRRGPLLHLRTSDGSHITFAPLALQDGTRLYREILMRLPPHVLDYRLRIAARTLLGEQLIPRPGGGIEGTVHARPRRQWRWAAVCLILAIAGMGTAAALTLPPFVAVPVAVLALLAVGMAFTGFTWLSQQITISADGISVTYIPGGRARSIGWDEIQLIEHTPGEGMLRLRGERRLRCAGPTLLRPAERDAMRAFLHEYCINRGVPVVQRRWLF